MKKTGEGSKAKAEELRATSFTRKYEKVPFQTQRRVSNLTYACVLRGPKFPENPMSEFPGKFRARWDAGVGRRRGLGFWVRRGFHTWRHAPPGELEPTS